MSAEMIPAAGVGGVANPDAVAYGLLVQGLKEAGARLAGLAEQVRVSYRYVERCAEGVDQLADQMQELTVDVDTLGEHREAANLMRSVLSSAEDMAAGIEDLSTAFAATADAHQGDYGSVAAAATSMTAPMADAGFYSNR
jgi:methyl-accepting chemotaxis protein